MRFEEAIAGLPATYAEALRLRRQGLSGQEITVLLGVPPDSIDTLLQLAEAKLAAILHGMTTDDADTSQETT